MTLFRRKPLLCTTCNNPRKFLLITGVCRTCMPRTKPTCSLYKASMPRATAFFRSIFGAGADWAGLRKRLDPLSSSRTKPLACFSPRRHQPRMGGI